MDARATKFVIWRHGIVIIRTRKRVPLVNQEYRNLQNSDTLPRPYTRLVGELIIAHINII